MIFPRAALSLAMIAGFVLVDCNTASAETRIIPPEVVRSYGLSVGEKIGKSLRYPKDALAGRLEATTVVVITTDREGNVKDAYVEETSSIDSFDAESLAAVRRASPFGKVPDEWAGETLKYRMPVAFKLCPPGANCHK